MLRRPYFFCLYKRNRGKKIHSRGRAFYKAALPLENPPPPKMGDLSGLTVGQGASRPLPLPNTPVQAVLYRKQLPRRPRVWPPYEPKFDGSFVGGGPRMSRCRQFYPVQKSQTRSAGGVHRGGRMSLREQSLSASPTGRFLGDFFWAMRERRRWRSQATEMAGQALALPQAKRSGKA